MKFKIHLYSLYIANNLNIVNVCAKLTLTCLKRMKIRLLLHFHILNLSELESESTIQYFSFLTQNLKFLPAFEHQRR